MPWRSTPGDPMACASAMPLSMATRASTRAPTRREREAHVDGQRRLARLERRGARRARRRCAALRARRPPRRAPGARRRASATRRPPAPAMPCFCASVRSVVGDLRPRRAHPRRRTAPRAPRRSAPLRRRAPPPAPLAAPRRGARSCRRRRRTRPRSARARRARAPRSPGRRPPLPSRGRRVSRSPARASRRFHASSRSCARANCVGLSSAKASAFSAKRHRLGRARSPRARGGPPSRGTPRRRRRRRPSSRWRATVASSSPIFASQRPARAWHSRSASSPSDAYATSRISACLNANSRVPGKRACACSTRISAAASSRSASLAFGDADAPRGPRSHPTCPKTASVAAASRPKSSSASRCTCIAASIVGASDASRPAAARRASSSAKSGSPADCVRDRVGERLAARRRSRARRGSTRRWRATCLRESGRSSIRTWSRPSKRAGSSRQSVGRAAARTQTGAPGGAREEVVDPRQALGVGPLRVLEDDDERAACAPCRRACR